MKTFAILLTGLLSFSMAFAGQNSSGGSGMTANLASKAKIRAVLDAVTNVNDVVLSVQRTGGGKQYAATIKIEECVVQNLYNIVATPDGAELFRAEYVDQIYNSCQ